MGYFCFSWNHVNQEQYILFESKQMYVCIACLHFPAATELALQGQKMWALVKRRDCKMTLRYALPQQLWIVIHQSLGLPSISRTSPVFVAARRPLLKFSQFAHWQHSSSRQQSPRLAIVGFHQGSKSSQCNNCFFDFWQSSCLFIY